MTTTMTVNPGAANPTAARQRVTDAKTNTIPTSPTAHPKACGRAVRAAAIAASEFASKDKVRAAAFIIANQATTMPTPRTVPNSQRLLLRRTPPETSPSGATAPIPCTLREYRHPRPNRA